MSVEPTSRSKTRLWVGVVVVAVGAVACGALWAVYGGAGLRGDLTSGDADRMRAALAEADSEALKDEAGRETSRLTVEAMKNMSIEEMMGMWQDEGLTDEQRARMGANMQIVFMNYMGQVAEEFYNAPPDKKDEILDRQIDEWMEFRDRMEEYREAHRVDPEYQARRERERERWRNPSREDRKNQMVNQDPDRQMKMWNMFGQMRRRAQERGLDFGWGRRGDRDRDKQQDDSGDRTRRRRGERTED